MTRNDVKWHTLTAAEVQKILRSDEEKGLSSAEASANLEIYGENVLKSKKKKGLVRRFFEQFKDLLVIILIAAAVISFATSYIGGEGDLIDPIIILFIVIMNAVMGVIQENKAEKAIDALQKLTAPTSKVIRNGKTQKIPSSKLVPGDIILLSTGDLISADARIIKSYSLTAQESGLTGESAPVEKDADVICKENTAPSDRKNMLFSGGIIVSGNCTAIVTQTGMNTQVGKIAGMLNEQEAPATPLQKKLSKVGKSLGIGAVLICAVLFVYGIITGSPILESLMLSVSLAVAAIPEGLPAIVTVVLAIGVQRMAKSNAIIRKLPAVETLGSASVICSDKTGTLTENKMEVIKTSDSSEVFSPNTKRAEKVLKLASLCCNVSSRKSGQSMGNPTEDAITNAFAKYHGGVEDLQKQYPKIFEIPFSSEKKTMTTLRKNGGGYLTVSKGAPERILENCSHFLGNGTVKELNTSEKSEILRLNDSMAKDALRVIAVAYRKDNERPSENSLEKNLVFVGLIGMMDPPRKEAAKAVEICKKAGIKPVMITGDHALTATAIAKKLNICKSGEIAIEGREIDKMSDEVLREAVKKASVFARVSPEHKVRIVKAFRENGEVVAMTGDGVNDAPALKAADIGCAMGKSGTDVAKNASDMILTDDNFETIVNAVSEGRNIFDNIKKSAHFLISSNIGEIIVIFASTLLGYPPALLPIQLLWINLVTDSLPAMALGVEPAEKGIMERRPQPLSGGLFGKTEAFNIAVEGLLIGFLSLFAFIIGLNFSGGYNLPLARTMAFTVLGISQLIHSFNMRSEYSLFKIGVFSNRKMIHSFLICVLLQVSAVVVPSLSSVFKTCAPDLSQWIIIIILAFVPLFAVEAEKAIALKKSQNPQRRIKRTSKAFIKKTH